MDLKLGVINGVGMVTGAAGGVGLGSYLIDKPKEWIVSKIGNGMLWAGGKLINGVKFGFIKLGEFIDKGGDVIADDLVGVFIIGSMVGVLISMTGNKEIGTKVSSISFLAYLVIRVLL